MDTLIRLFGIPPAYAQDGGAGTIIQLLPLIAIFGVFYFILIRPQQKKQKDHRTMIDALAKGDKVVTGGGIVGTVIKVDPGKEEMFIEIAPNVRVTVLRSTVSTRIDPNAGKEAPKPANDARSQAAKAASEAKVEAGREEAERQG
ncbi:MAG: preprotein translocase subunit YajC [Acetobacteraceae bacterium]|nr:preprotein translocase subunit YajC [Acetobacteraceae bacterium]